MTTQGVKIMRTGGSKDLRQTPGHMNKISMESAFKMIGGIGSNLNCYVCRINVAEGDGGPNSIDIGIRKVGKKYKKVIFHISCEEDRAS